MTARLTLPAPLAVLAAHGHVGWVTTPAECPAGDRFDLGRAGVHGHLTECACGGSRRNPLLDLAGQPCPECNGAPWIRSDTKCCPDCAGTGLASVELWTATTPPEPGWFGDLKYDPKLESLVGRVNELWPVPLGVRVGWATIKQALPIVGNCQPLPEGHTRGVLRLRNPDQIWLTERDSPNIEMTDQLAFDPSGWTPGRCALELADVRPA